MSLVWAICGASRGVGKTHLSQRLLEVLPNAVCVKCGHGTRQEGKPGHYLTNGTELEALLAGQASGHDHVIVESNAFARHGQSDLVLYLEGPPGPERRADADELRSCADLVVGSSEDESTWRARLRTQLQDEGEREAVLAVLREQSHHAARARPRSSADMIPLEEAYRRLDVVLEGKRLPVETIPTRLALGRVLAAEQVSQLDLPPFDKSAMDGYAIPAGCGDRYVVMATVAAGEVPGASLALGTAVKVMTGAPVPAGTERVIMVEDTEQSGETVLIRERRGGTNICPRGEDVRAGDVILPEGTTLSALALANLISCGVVEIPVARRPRLAVISTGTEIVDAVERLGPGKIMNSNGPLLAGLGREYGLEVVSERSYGDELAALRAGIAQGVKEADLVVLSGGVSAGDFDFVPRALEELGFQLQFTRVAMKPGKPLTLATRAEKVVLGLPGNPVSVFLTFHLFVLRAVARLTGAALPGREVCLPLGAPFRRRNAERQEFVPARMTGGGHVTPLEYHGSAHLSALSLADGFFVVPAGITELADNERVAFLPLGRRWL